MTFPAVWDELLRRLATTAGGPGRPTSAHLDLVRMPEVGRYYYRGEETSLPVAARPPVVPGVAPLLRPARAARGRRLDAAARRPPRPRRAPGAAPAARRLRVAADHPLLPRRPALAARRAARHHRHPHPQRGRLAVAHPGAVREHAGDHGRDRRVGAARRGATRSCSRWCGWPRRPGSRSHRGEAVTRIERGRVTTTDAEHRADLVVSALDADRWRRGSPGGPRGRPALGPRIRARRTRALLLGDRDLRGAARRAAGRLAAHSVVLPTAARRAVPQPRGGRRAGGHHGVRQPVPRGRGVPEPAQHRSASCSPRPPTAVGLHRSTTRSCAVRSSGSRPPSDSTVPAHRPPRRATSCSIPRYYGAFGEPHGALYGAARPVWLSGPLPPPVVPRPVRARGCGGWARRCTRAAASPRCWAAR